MALIKCECGKEISDKAYECPHCGKKYNQSQSRSVKTMVIIFTIIVIAIVLVIIYAMWPEQKEEITEDGLYRLLNVTISVSKGDFKGNDDGMGPHAAPEIYVIIFHNKQKILNTFEKAFQDSWQASHVVSADIMWAKGDDLTVEVWDKDLAAHDHIINAKIEHLHEGTVKVTTRNNSKIALQLDKIQ